MSLTAFSVDRRAVIYFATFLIIVAGLASFFALGQLEDPEFTVKTAVIVTPYPGASPEEVELEVSDRIELGIRGSEEVESAAQEHREYIAGETLAVGVQIGSEGDGGSEEWRDSELDGHPVRIGLRRAR